jgi:hypothetical protein
MLRGDALGHVAEQHNGWLHGGRQARQRDGVVGEFEARICHPVWR